MLFPLDSSWTPGHGCWKQQHNRRQQMQRPADQRNPSECTCNDPQNWAELRRIFFKAEEQRNRMQHEHDAERCIACRNYKSATDERNGQKCLRKACNPKQCNGCLHFHISSSLPFLPTPIYASHPKKFQVFRMDGKCPYFQAGSIFHFSRWYAILNTDANFKEVVIHELDLNLGDLCIVFGSYLHCWIRWQTRHRQKTIMWNAKGQRPRAVLFCRLFQIRKILLSQRFIHQDRCRVRQIKWTDMFIHRNAQTTV